MKNIKYINAGAGSGKTYFLTETFAQHVKNGDCTPSEVIMTTFSEKAAADIKRNARIRFLENGLDDAAAQLDTANIGTVHSIALSYIRKYWYLLGISAKCEVMTDENKEAYISSTLGNVTDIDDIKAFHSYAVKVDLKPAMSSKFDYDFWKSAAAGIISKADSMGISDLEESRVKSLDLIDRVCRANEHYALIRDCADRVFRITEKWRGEFERYKKDNSVIDYNDMENLFLKMLKEPGFEDVRKDISESVKYVFVDEFQDSNPKQLEIFDSLSELVTKSYWVGDPKQAIYGFRACDTDLVQALADEIRKLVSEGKEGFETGRLNDSRRSLEPLVKFTNDVFVNVFPEMDRDDVVLNPFRKESLPECVPNIQHWDGPLRPGKPKKDGMPGAPSSPSKDETISALASEVRKILDGKSTVREIFDKDSGELRAVRPSDMAVLCRTNADVDSIAAEFKKYGIPVSLESVADASMVEIRLVLLMLNHVLGKAKLLTAELAKVCCGLSLSDIVNKDYDDIEKLTAFLDSYREDFASRSVSSIVRGIIIRMGLLDGCARWGDAFNRRNNLMALIQNARDYESDCLTLGRSATVEGFISEIENGNISVSGYSAGVNVITYHGSKGLQWPLVFMFSLANDRLSDQQISKSFLWDVRHVRKDKPASGNLYPGYYLTYVPKLGSGSKSLPEDMKSGIDGVTGVGNYEDFRDSVIREGRRLLYVAVTRARDIFVEVGQHAKENKMITETMKDLYADPKWKSQTGKDWGNGTCQQIWGPGTPLFYYREMAIDPAPEVHEAETYTYMPEKKPDGTIAAKKISPSSISDDGLVAGSQAECISSDGLFRQVISKASEAEDDEVGTCIHNIFATYDPSRPREDMLAIAERTIRRHGLQDVLPQPESIIGSEERLYKILEEKYGKATRIEHEFPFSEIIDGQTIVGSIDLVWFTSENECVLVDIKNRPGATRLVLKPDDRRFLGQYAPQLNAYRTALERGGLTVKDSIIYLAMQAEAIRITC